MNFNTLYDLYIIKEFSTVDIGKIFNKHPTTIRTYLINCNIPLRNKQHMTSLRLEKLSKSMSGKNNHRWTGGIKILKGKYIGVHRPEHPYCNSQGYVSQHRLIVEDNINRYLLPTEIVHHIDGNNKNNDISNLEVIVNQATHAKTHYYKRNKNSKGQFMS